LEIYFSANEIYEKVNDSIETILKANSNLNMAEVFATPEEVNLIKASGREDQLLKPEVLGSEHFYNKKGKITLLQEFVMERKSEKQSQYNPETLWNPLVNKLSQPFDQQLFQQMQKEYGQH
jgi:hypothetical protein